MLPVVKSWDAMPDKAVLRADAARLSGELGMDVARLTRFEAGSRPVYAAGDLVLKLFPQADGVAYAVEAGVLGAVQGKLPIQTPRVHAVGEHDGWGYVLMSRLPGIPLDEAWPQLMRKDRDRIAVRLGETIAALHELPPPVIPGWWPDDWATFTAGQRAGCTDEQRAWGLAPEWVEQIPGFLAEVTLPGEPLVLLHTEIMREHLLVRQDDSGAWQLSGLIDFEPAMRGAREYEFVALGCFVSEGDARFLRRTLIAYGYAGNQLDEALHRRLMAWTILHRYSNLAAYLRGLPASAEPSFGALADCWFAT
jgi:hygromycin-B 7''-O-kinase